MGIYMKIKKNKIQKNEEKTNNNINYFQEEILNDLEMRLKKIEGQIKGICKMIKAQRSCEEVILQVIAVRSAINSFAIKFLDEHLKYCIKPALKNDNCKIIESFSNLFEKMLKNF